MPSGRWERLLTASPLRLAIAYLIATAAFLVLLKTLLARYAPEASYAISWDNPSVLAVIALVIAGSVATVLSVILLRGWLRPSFAFDRAAWRSRITLLPIFSGACTAIIVPITILVAIIHGPLVAIVATRGTGIVSARIVDQLLLMRGLSDRPVSRREDWASILAALAVWIGIVVPSSADASVYGAMPPDAWLLLVYVAAYSLRLWFINVYKNRCEAAQSEGGPAVLATLSEEQRTLGYFALEELAAMVTLALVAAPIVINRLHVAGTTWNAFSRELLATWPTVLCGIPLGISAIAAVSLLLFRRHTATYTFVLYRIAGSLGSFVATGLLLGLGIQLAARDWVSAVTFFVALLWLYVPGRNSMRSNGDGVRRFVRFVFIIIALIYTAQDAQSWLRILSNSPYANVVNWIAAGGTLLLSSAASALPVLALVTLVLVVFETPSTRHDIAILIDYGARTLEPHQEMSEGQARRVTAAVSRIGLIIGVMSGLIALGTWMQEAGARRISATKDLAGTFSTPEVRGGRSILRHSILTRAAHDSASCALCAGLHAYFRGDSMRSGERDTIDEVNAALNAVESVLEFRRSGALSELEFHSQWAGVTREVLDATQVHLDGTPGLQAQIGKYLPTLSQQMSAQPWPSDVDTVGTGVKRSLNRMLMSRGAR